MCKLDRFVKHYASIALTFLLNVNKITPRQANIACIIIVFSSIILSAPMTVFYDIIRVNNLYSGAPYEAGFECTPTNDESMEFYLLLTYVIHLAGFVATAFSLTLFYILIGYTLLKQRKFRILTTRVARNLSVVGIRCRQFTRKLNHGPPNGKQKGYNIQHAIENGKRSERVRRVSFQTHDIIGNDKGLSVSYVLDFEEIIASDMFSVSSVSEPRVTSGNCIVHMENGQVFKHDLSLTSDISSLSIAEITHISSTINEGNITDMTSPSDVGSICGFDSNALTTHIHSVVAPTVATDNFNRTVNAHSSTTKYTLIMFLVSACCVLSFLPFLSLMVWRIYHNVQEVNEMSNVELILYSIGLRSYFLNSTVNPLIYGLFNTEFRSFFFGSFCKCRQAK
ncbi:hypothetical protein ACJMK2_000392 [Sinanodonta woodiana]|uniref:G-protein coupled receptors family 1 profile domain-containing protein n=1 Tax=Sinanodonta woodiana TaxID=1069815 RepID=A0ABD3XSK7_SINWO